MWELSQAGVFAKETPSAKLLKLVFARLTELGLSVAAVAREVDTSLSIVKVHAVEGSGTLYA
eukprot:689211-Amphidinium_carterae.1